MMEAAAVGESIPIAERLVAAGADARCPLALCTAARQCNLEFVKYLLDLRSDPNGRGRYDAVPLVKAVTGAFRIKRIGPGQEIV
jgi:ankyrin repeat protein